MLHVARYSSYRSIHSSTSPLAFCDQRKVTHISEYKPNYSDKNYHRHVNPYRIKHGLEPFEQSRVLGEETRKEAYIKYEYHQGYQTDHDRIAHTVDQQRT